MHKPCYSPSVTKGQFGLRTGPGYTLSMKGILALSALVEMAFGAAALVFPTILSLLLGAPLDWHGLLVARMLAVAALSLGITWWRGGRSKPEHLTLMAGGYVAYNVGVGVLFIIAARSTNTANLPWLVAIFHLLSASALIAVVLRRAHQT